jgi:hypothetical protein
LGVSGASASCPPDRKTDTDRLGATPPLHSGNDNGQEYSPRDRDCSA